MGINDLHLFNASLWVTEYRTLVEAEANPRHFIEEVYTTKRLHLSLGQVPPAEFEVACTQ
jgi:transposase InsO family protein